MKRFLIALCFFYGCLPQCVSSYNPPKASLVVNADTGEILHKENAYLKRHPASLTKKMTLYLLFDALKKGRIRLDTKFTTSKLAAFQKPTNMGLKAGESVCVEDLIKGLIVKSANDASIVVAENLSTNVGNFVQAMNQKAHELDMQKTIFQNPSGLPHAQQWSSAYDMYLLANALYHDFPEYWHYFKLKHFTYRGKVLKTHNFLLLSYPHADGIKTGFVNASGFNLSTSAVRYKPDGSSVRLFVVVMGGETRHKRDAKVAQLLDTYFAQERGSNVHDNKAHPNTLVLKSDEIFSKTPLSDDQATEKIEALMAQKDGLFKSFESQVQKISHNNKKASFKKKKILKSTKIAQRKKSKIYKKEVLRKTKKQAV